jgi:hypothetical protein
MLWRNMFVGSLVALGILTGATTFAQTSVHASPPAVGLVYDEQVLKDASLEIMAMGYQQLSALKEYISACQNTLSSHEEILFACYKARSNYDIEFGSHSKLDSLIFHVDFFSTYIRLSEAAHKKIPDDGKLIKRLLDINGELRRIANIRFGMLRATAQSP